MRCCWVLRAPGLGAGLSVEVPQPGVPSGVQSPTGRPPLASPGQPAPPTRSASDRTLQPGSATSTPSKAGAPAAGAAAAASKGMPIKGDRGRFKVYEVLLLLMPHAGQQLLCWCLIHCKQGEVILFS